MPRGRVRGYARGAVCLGLVGCGGSGDAAPEQTPVPALVSGPLCDALPAGDDPGAPESLVDEPADVVLTWIPVATTFEAAVRATGLAGELRAMDGVTILAPTDEAFDAAFSRRRLDALLLTRRRELRAILEAHLIEGARSLEQLREAGEATTLAGDPLTVSPAAAMVRFGDRAETVCADYAAANARIHVVDGVLGAP